MKEGSLVFILRDDNCFLIRFFHLIGFAVVRHDNEVGIGYQLSVLIWKIDIGINLTKRRGDYVKRIKDETGPEASA